MSRQELYGFITEYVGKWIELIDDRSIDEFHDKREGKVLTLQFEEMFFHLVNHFTYHRGQIVVALKILGRDVPMTLGEK